MLARRGPLLLPPWCAEYPGLPDDFETAEDAVRELGKRRRLLLREDSLLARQLFQHVATPPRGGLPKPSLANPLFYRWARIRFLAGCHKFLTTHPGPYRFVTLIPPEWFVPDVDLDPKLHQALRWGERLRKHINDAGGLPPASLMIGGLHASFERSPTGGHTGFQFHYHLVTNEAALPVIDQLRRRRAYKPSDWVDTPVQDKPAGTISSIAGVLTYLAKSYWSNRNSIDAEKHEDMVRTGSRIQGVNHTRALAWANAQQFGDTIFCSGGRLPKSVYEKNW